MHDFQPSCAAPRPVRIRFLTHGRCPRTCWLRLSSHELFPELPMSLGIRFGPRETISDPNTAQGYDDALTPILQQQQRLCTDTRQPAVCRLIPSTFFSLSSPLDDDLQPLATSPTPDFLLSCSTDLRQPPDSRLLHFCCDSLGQAPSKP